MSCPVPLSRHEPDSDTGTDTATDTDTDTDTVTETGTATEPESAPRAGAEPDHRLRHRPTRALRRPDLVTDRWGRSRTSRPRCDLDAPALSRALGRITDGPRDERAT
jgi:hypothetical protein